MKQPGVDQSDVDRAIQVVSAYVGNNHINADDLPKFMEGIFETVTRLSANLQAVAVEPRTFQDDRVATSDMPTHPAPRAQDADAPEPAAESSPVTSAKSMPADPAPAALKPAVPIDQSVHSDHIVCLEDGRSFKSLKRHLSSGHGLTPEQYRAKWDLPFDYPMVSAEYAQERSYLAKEIGLGSSKKRKATILPPAAAPTAKAKRGRPVGSRSMRSRKA